MPSSAARYDVDGDYLDVTGPRDAAEVMVVVAEALTLPCSAWDTSRIFPWARLSSSMSLVIEYASGGSGTARVGVADDAVVEPQSHAIARRLRRAFADRPGWTVVHTTD